VAKPEWGTKRTCYGCGARFYDLRRDPIACPVCAAVYDPARQPRPKRGGTTLRDEPVPVADAAALRPGPLAGAGVGDEEEAADLDIEELDDSAEVAGDDADLDELSTEEGAVIEDTSDLGEDDDDIGEVMEHVDDDLEDKG
jgi:uncharacterized protein (TIGR02300 family)